MTYWMSTNLFPSNYSLQKQEKGLKLSSVIIRKKERVSEREGKVEGKNNFKKEKEKKGERYIGTQKRIDKPLNTSLIFIPDNKNVLALLQF